ncbi:hypothetical protein O181_111924 [Austropuccinia psidii MF-1]|uniref:Uncharacterized protein n=1 Tax=Austropuccinia psidii MF-1 TaxID=1389203 RepID=A0A9Q3PS92_9BASI|nr:hypothetical protein [Austropuccinia psidii MF-1]
MEIKEEAENENKFILTEEEFPWEGYTNWQPLRDANLVEQNNNNPRNNCEGSNQHVKWLEDITTPKKKKLEIIKDRSSKKKKNTKVEKEYFWLTQNKKLYAQACKSIWQSNIRPQHKMRIGQKIIIEMKISSRITLMSMNIFTIKISMKKE